jgi:hypothetical protein
MTVDVMDSAGEDFEETCPGITITTVPEVLVTSSEGHKGCSGVEDSVSAGLVGAGEGDTAGDPV